MASGTRKTGLVAPAALDAGRFAREIAAGYDPGVIAAASIVLVGTGALGQFLALCLALIGFPDVTFIDVGFFDDVSNITRSPFYREGMPKARAVAAGARAMCTCVGRVSYRFARAVIQELGDALLVGDNVLVFSAVDNAMARSWLAQRTRACGVPLIEGGFRGERWNLSVFPNSSSDEPCWHCGRPETTDSKVFSCETYARVSEERGFIPATAPGAMGLAAAMVEAGMALLHGDLALANTSVFTNMRSGISQIMKRALDPDCPLDHRIIRDSAVPLTCSHSNSVGAVLDGLAAMAADPIVRLPATFVCVAPCRKCHHPVLANRPEWSLPEAVHCTQCGGMLERTDRVPEQHGFLSRRTLDSIRKLPLWQVGIGPGMHLIVDGSDSEIPVVLAGNAGELLSEFVSDVETKTECVSEKGA